VVVALDVDEGERPGDSDTLTVVTLWCRRWRAFWWCAHPITWASGDVRIWRRGVWWRARFGWWCRLVWLCIRRWPVKT